jgi:Flp pilus assembly protein TadB
MGTIALDNSNILYVLLALVVLLFFRIFQGIMRNRREDKEFERTQDIVHKRTKKNTATSAVDGRNKGSNRRLGFRRKNDRREKIERRTSARRDEKETSDWDGEDNRGTERRGVLRRLLDRRRSDRRNRDRRKQ